MARSKCEIRRSLYGVFSTIVCLAGYAVAHHFAMRDTAFSWLLVVSNMFLCGFCGSFYLMARSPFVSMVIGERNLGAIVGFIAGLSLDIYVSHRSLLTAQLNGIFPLNILVVYVEIVVLAYVVRTLGRFICQTFSSELEYDWQKLFK